MAEVRYVAIGDSFTEGLGDEPVPGVVRGWADLTAQGWADATGSSVEYANLAIRGKLARPIIAEQLEPALALKPTHLSFNGGGNDMLRPRTPLALLADLFAHVLRRCDEEGVTLILLSGGNPSGQLPMGRLVQRRGDELSALVEARFAGRDDTMTYVSLQTQTGDEIRQGLARVLKVGLVRYAAATPVADRLDVSYRAPEARAEEVAGGEHDPWNFWVFRMSTGGSFSGETSTNYQSLRGSLSANRTTAAWKINLSANVNYSRSRYDLGDDEIYTTIRRSWGSQGLVVRSLGPHWSAGLKASASSSTYLNQDLSVRIAPGIEWNLFPYDQSTRRQLTFQYTLGMRRFDYTEETLFDKTSENLADQTLIVSLSLCQSTSGLAPYSDDRDPV